ncbi:MAG: stage III sporulation protein AF [Lachnospiraceae bacterium]|nr:stage III sporulation protein AF [Lachnospiraceae bacterium]MDE6979852.1 stage III sporulation protein AF [Lachnospiraceae bacterium]
MEGLVGWVKNYSMVFLFFTVLSSLAAKKEYRRYLSLFVEFVLVVTLLMPVLKLVGSDTDFFDKIAYDTFWQELNSIKADRENLDFLGEDVYRERYEEVIGADVRVMAEDAGYGVMDVRVNLSQEFEIESMELDLAKEQEYTVIQGSLTGEPEEEGFEKLKEKISSFYQVDIENIRIWN